MKDTQKELLGREESRLYKTNVPNSRKGLSEIIAATELAGKSLKAQMRAANRVNAVCAVIVGDEELAKEVAVLKDLAGGEQKEVAFADLKAEIEKLIK